MAFLDHQGGADFPYPREQVFDALLQVIPTVGMKVDRHDRATGLISAKAGVSLMSWGENIPISITETAPGRSRVAITSTPKTGVLFGGAFDLGKNRGNIEKILFEAARVLGGSMVRDCPNCMRPMQRGASACPHCQHESNPWIHHAGVWWVAGTKTGEWQWFDETANTWRWYKDGTPSNPSTTDKTPSRAIDPAFVQPPAAESESPTTAAASESQSRSPVDELEQIAALHARGVLTDEEFQAAKARVLGL
jgi:hypothetical protein